MRDTPSALPFPSFHIIPLIQSLLCSIEDLGEAGHGWIFLVGREGPFEQIAPGLSDGSNALSIVVLWKL